MLDFRQRFFGFLLRVLSVRSVASNDSLSGFRFFVAAVLRSVLPAAGVITSSGSGFFEEFRRRFFRRFGEGFFFGGFFDFFFRFFRRRRGRVVRVLEDQGRDRRRGGDFAHRRAEPDAEGQHPDHRDRDRRRRGHPRPAALLAVAVPLRLSSPSLRPRRRSPCPSRRPRRASRRPRRAGGRAARRSSGSSAGPAPGGCRTRCRSPAPPGRGLGHLCGQPRLKPIIRAPREPGCKDFASTSFRLRSGIPALIHNS